ncbi:hypothetical protein NECID01_1324 [Nematocida sp. AWRm77]|nr:hypothetical protein NECID01_1324 [Nematocida sp. AWRm77]
MLLKRALSEDLSIVFENYTKLRGQVAVNLGSSLLGLFYSLGVLYSTHEAVEGIVSSVFALCGFALYLMLQRVLFYGPTDLCIYMIATNTRAIKTIIGKVEAEGKAAADKKPNPESASIDKPQKKGMSLCLGKWGVPSSIWAVLFPRECAQVSFDRALEEMLFRVLILCVSKHTFLLLCSGSDFMSCVMLLVKGAVVGGVSYAVRYLEHIVAKSPPPGLLSPKISKYYGNIVSLVLVHECVLS